MSTRPIRRFSEMLAILNRGRFEEKLDELLTKTCETLENLPEQSGKAVVNMTFTLTYSEGRYGIKPAVKLKLPEDKAFSETPFFAAEGGLSLQHPSQTDMFAGPRDAGERTRAAV